MGDYYDYLLGKHLSDTRDPEGYALKAEGWAKGTQNNIPVTSGSPYYEDNAKYYLEQAEAVAESIPEDYTTLSDAVMENDARFEYTIINGFDKTDITAGGYWNHNGGGSFVSVSNWSACNKYIPVKAGNKYSTWRYASAGTGFVSHKTFSICWYDADKSFLSGTYNVSNELTAPANAHYVRMSYSTDIKYPVFKSGWDMPTVYMTYSIEQNMTKDVNIYDNEVVHKIPIFTDEFNYSSYVITGKFINKFLQIVDSESLAYAKIPVNAGEIYKIRGQVYSAATLYGFMLSDDTYYYCYPDSASNIIPTSGGVALTLEVIVEVPSDATYMVVNKGGAWVTTMTTKIWKADGYGYELVSDVKLPRVDDRLSAIESYQSNGYGNPLWGKKLATAGTSITYGAEADIDPTTGVRMTYGAITAKNNNMSFVNYGINGSTLQYIADKNPFCDPARYQSMDADIDYLTIEFGWNDYAYGTLGTITDAVNTTYYGAWNTVLPWLIEHYPNTKIGLIVPYGTDENMREAVRLIAKKYGLGYMDMTGDPNIPLIYNRESSFNVDATIQTLWRTRFIADGAHPNNAGYTAWATAFENFLRSL